MLPLRDVNPTRVRPLITLALIAVNVAVFFGLQPSDIDEGAEYLYRNAAISCEITTWAPLTLDEIRTERCLEGGRGFFSEKSIPQSIVFSMFLHGGIAHIAFNMWSLWIFGNNVEEAFGRQGYLLFYLASGLAATFTFVALNPDLTIPLVGASGAIAGVMGAYLVLFPRHLVMTLIFIRVVAIPAIIFLGFWFISQFFVGDVGVAWEAHVGGFLFGAAIALPFRERLLRRTQATPAGVFQPY